ncbi:MAG: hypothetical protein C4296_03290 [Gemmataceae bacterium]
MQALRHLVRIRKRGPKSDGCGPGTERDSGSIAAAPLPVHVLLCWLFLLTFPMHRAPGAARGPELVQAPLLYVRLQAPEGSSIQLATSQGARQYDTPAVVALRPGYGYHISIFALRSGKVRVEAHGTLTVLDTLLVPVRTSAISFPAPLPITDEDLDAAESNQLVTKVVVVETARPGWPGTSTVAQPAVLEVPPAEDLEERARRWGRPLLILRLGQRQPEPRDPHVYPSACPFGTCKQQNHIRTQAGHGSTWPYRPGLPASSRTVFNRPADPEENLIRDGGDFGQPVRLTPQGASDGLEPGDAVIEYRSSQQVGKSIVPANPVFIWSPRFLIFQQMLGFDALTGTDEAGHMQSAQARAALVARDDLRQVRQRDDVHQAHVRSHLHANIGRSYAGRIEEINTLDAVHIEVGSFAYWGSERFVLVKDEQKKRMVQQIAGARALSRRAAIAGVHEDIGIQAVGRVEGMGTIQAAVQTSEAVSLDRNEPVRVPEKPLQILKWASKETAQPGDIVTFFIRYSNLGGQPIHDIAITDSLSGRLEYIPCSAASDREAIFATQTNEEGSVILRWEIRDPLPPKAHGVVRYQVRVR